MAEGMRVSIDEPGADQFAVHPGLERLGHHDPFLGRATRFRRDAGAAFGGGCVAIAAILALGREALAAGALVAAGATVASCRVSGTSSTDSSFINYSKLTKPGFASISAIQAWLTPMSAPSWA